MRTLVFSLLLAAAPAAAEPVPDLPERTVVIDITEQTISGAGGVDRIIMRDAFDATTDAVYNCWDALPSRPAKLNVVVSVRFRINDHGAVPSASVVGLPSVNSCLAAALKAAQFNTPNKGAMDVTQKVAFRTFRRPAASADGLLGSAALTQGGAFASLTGTGEVSTGFDDTQIYGGLVGAPSGPAPVVSLGQPVVQGDLDKALIRRYLKRNIQKIQYCYEHELQSKPKLAGTVQAQFTIGADGNVTTSTGAGVDPAVSSCIAEVIQHIEFPKPKTGGLVLVNYPLAFHPASDARQP